MLQNHIPKNATTCIISTSAQIFGNVITHLVVCLFSLDDDI